MAVTRNRVIIWYHESDQDLVKELEEHLQLLVWRLGKQYVLHFFGYPQSMPKPPSSEEYSGDKWKWEEYQARYARLLQAFSRCALLVPCLSNACMVQMCLDTERDSRLSQILAQPAFGIMPVLMRPTNTGEANPSEPLNAYAGYQREVACQHLAATLERMLRANSDFKPASLPLATLLIAEAPPKAVKKRWWSLFR